MGGTVFFPSVKEQRRDLGYQGKVVFLLDGRVAHNIEKFHRASQGAVMMSSCLFPMPRIRLSLSTSSQFGIRCYAVDDDEWLHAIAVCRNARAGIFERAGLSSESLDWFVCGRGGCGMQRNIGRSLSTAIPV
jgi:hypothetical protein